MDQAQRLKRPIRFGGVTTKVECYNYHRRGHFARECRAPKNQRNRNNDASTRNAPVDTSTTNALVVQEGIGGYDWCFHAEKGLTNFALMAYTSQGSSSSDSEDNEYHAIPPPYTGNYIPPKDDLSFARLDNYVFKSKVSETITSVPKIETNASKTSKDSLEKPKIVRSSAPLIEEWESDSKDENVFKPKEVKKTVKPSLEKIKFVNARNTTIENENKAKNLGSSVRVLGKKITGLEEIRQVWVHIATVNHQSKLTHPHPKRNFVPAAVLTKSGQVPVNAAKQSSHRAAASVSAARRVNTTASRPNVNNALPTTNSYFKAHLVVRRPFNQKSKAKTNNFNEKVNTARDDNVTTAGPKAVVKVIVNGDAPASIALVSGGAEAAIPLKTTEQKIARRDELKAKSSLLLAISDEHLLKF
uniref:Uncharacterized protein n=1 Tax=Tanacetum cinerariifolium TaxID=118510 RepID=A0A6L2KSD2_TANCI|nr:hypothetical protein [Tanacetum cinerariifolium]